MANEIKDTTWKSSQMQMVIEWQKFKVSMDGKDITISEEALKSIKEKIKDITEEEFKQKLPPINNDIEKAIIEKIGKDSFKTK